MTAQVQVSSCCTRAAAGQLNLCAAGEQARAAYRGAFYAEQDAQKAARVVGHQHAWRGPEYQQAQERASELHRETETARAAWWAHLHAGGLT